MIYNFVVAFSFLLIATFSYWYSSKLANYKKTSFTMSFFVVIVSYTLAGTLKLLIQNYISHYSIILMFITLVVLQIYLGSFIFKEKLSKTAITSILSLIVSIIIGLPILVLSGIAITYLHIKH